MIEPLHIRGDGDGRTLEGIVVPWMTPAPVVETNPVTGELEAYSEQFHQRSFDALAAHAKKRGLVEVDPARRSATPTTRRWTCRSDHDVEIDNTHERGAKWTGRLFGGPQLEKLQSMIEEGAASGLSIKFSDSPSRSRDGDLITRQQVFVRHIGMTPAGAQVYADAGVMAMRSNEGIPAIETPALAEHRAWWAEKFGEES